MNRNRNNRISEIRSGGKLEVEEISIVPKESGLTAKQLVFVETYIQTLNAVKSAETAGYSSPKMASGMIMSSENVKREIDKRLRARLKPAMVTLCAIEEIAEGLDESVFDVVDGEPIINWEEVKKQGKLHLIEGITFNKTGKAIVKMMSKQDAMLLLARYHDLINEGSSTTINSSAPVQINFLEDIRRQNTEIIDVNSTCIT
jgi:phage terminase small subunit